MISQYRKKPIVIEAIQWTGENTDELTEFAPNDVWFDHEYGICYVITLEGTVTAAKGDWIIKGVKGEFYPIKESIFLETYEKETSE